MKYIFISWLVFFNINYTIAQIKTKIQLLSRNANLSDTITRKISKEIYNLDGQIMQKITFCNSTWPFDCISPFKNKMEYLYNDKKQLIKTITFSCDKNDTFQISSKTRFFTYDNQSSINTSEFTVNLNSKRQVTRKVSISNPSTYFDYWYDGKGTLRIEKKMDGENINPIRTKKYGIHGKLTEVILMTKLMKQYSYDSKGNCTKYEYFGIFRCARGPNIKSWEQKFNNKGQLIVKLFSFGDNKLGKTIYSYNNQGQLVLEQYTLLNGNYTSRKESSYNINGDLLEKKVFTNNILDETIRYEYEYY